MGYARKRAAALCCALFLLSCATEGELLLLGDTCKRDEQCASGRCDELLCKDSTPAAEGEPCSQSLECLSEYCRADGRCGPGIRVLGAPCTAAEQCASSACRDGICVEQGDDGGTSDGADAGTPDSGDASADATGDAGDTGDAAGDAAFDPSIALVSSPVVCSADTDGWCWELPFPQPHTLHGVWASSDSDVFFVGAAGTVLHYDGSTWHPLASGVDSSLYGVWGSGKTNVYVVGDPGVVLHYDGTAIREVARGQQPLRAIWGSNPTHLLAVGEGGKSVHFDGSRWRSVNLGATADLNDVWSADDANFFVVGATGTVVHFDGSTATPMNAGTTTTLETVWGRSATEVFVAGGGAVSGSPEIYRYDGTVWVPFAGMATGYPGSKFEQLWGTSDGRLYAATWSFVPFGDGATGLYRYDGTSWQVLGPPIGLSSLNGLWGTSASSIYAAGSTGAALHSSGGAFSLLSAGNSLQPLFTLWGRSATDLYAVGRVVRHFDGSSWRTLDTGVSTYSGWAVACGNAADFYVFDSRQESRVYRNGQWEQIDGLPQAAYTAGWVSSNGDLFLGGLTGQAVTRIGGQWTQVSFGSQIKGLWGVDSSTVFGAANNGSIAHYDGRVWSTMTTPAVDSLEAIWGSSASDVYAVGCEGTIVHYDGSSWSTMPSNVTGCLNAVWGSSASEVYAVGQAGVILRLEQGSWRQMAPLSTDITLEGVWAGGGAAVAVSRAGHVLRLRR